MSGLSPTLSRLVRRHITQSCPATQRWRSVGPSTTPIPIPDFAFAFDIDGVLLHSNTPLPGAKAALATLRHNRIPYMLLTNGGGRLDAQRARDLGSHLESRISVENFVQSHTPFSELVDGTWDVGIKGGLADKTVFVTGSHGGSCRRVMESYGFTKVVTAADVLSTTRSIFPFKPITPPGQADGRPLPALPWTPGHDESISGPPLKIDAIFVLNDPRDWAVDIQIITDILASGGGVLGKPWIEGQSPPPPPIFFSNPDLTWATSYHEPRLGQGAFRAALEGVWNNVHGANGTRKPQIYQIGKPHTLTYRYAERTIEAHRNRMLQQYNNVPDAPYSESEEKATPSPSPLRRVYMVGDNPSSDICGANSYRSERGTEWWSILVRTGVFQRGEPEHVPKVIVDNVGAAVAHALKLEGMGEVLEDR